jgi:hypothetical protein
VDVLSPPDVPSTAPEESPLDAASRRVASLPPGDVDASLPPAPDEPDAGDWEPEDDAPNPVDVGAGGLVVWASAVSLCCVLEPHPLANDKPNEPRSHND